MSNAPAIVARLSQRSTAQRLTFDGRSLNPLGGLKMNDASTARTRTRTRTRRWATLWLGFAALAAPACAAAPGDTEAIDVNLDELGRASEHSIPELLCFTQGLGEFAPEAPPSYDESGELGFEGSSIQTRALLSHSYVDAAGYQRVRMRFTYAPQAVGSSDWRRQVSLKLKAANSCNVDYVTWVFEKAGVASNSLEIKRKSNPGQWLDSQCTDALGEPTGYTTIASAPLPGDPPAPGSTVTLEAELRGDALRVWVNGTTRFNQVVSGLGASGGWAGFRTDNVDGAVELAGSAQDPNLWPSPRDWYVATRSFDGTGSSKASGAPFSNSCPYVDGSGTSQVGASVQAEM
jgi:hypothetical protein